MLITSWAMKVKKKAMKLKELSVLQEKAQSLLHLHPCCTPREERCSYVSDLAMKSKIKGKGETARGWRQSRGTWESHQTLSAQSAGLEDIYVGTQLSAHTTPHGE